MQQTAGAPGTDRALDRILPFVEKPARYTGGEWNSVLKEWDATPYRLALVFPDTYELGMSNLGMMVLYDIVNRRPDMLAERAFVPWLDMDAAMRRAGVPLFALESRRRAARVRRGRLLAGVRAALHQRSICARPRRYPAEGKRSH